MTFSYKGNFPGFFLSPESHLVGFFKSSKIALWIENKGPPCFFTVVRISTTVGSTAAQETKVNLTNKVREGQIFLWCILAVLWASVISPSGILAVKGW